MRVGPRLSKSVGACTDSGGGLSLFHDWNTTCNILVDDRADHLPTDPFKLDLHGHQDVIPMSPSGPLVVIEASNSRDHCIPTLCLKLCQGWHVDRSVRRTAARSKKGSVCFSRGSSSSCTCLPFFWEYWGDLFAILASRVSNSFELCRKQIVSAAILTASSFVDSLHPTSRATLWAPRSTPRWQHQYKRKVFWHVASPLTWG